MMMIPSFRRPIVSLCLALCLVLGLSQSRSLQAQETERVAAVVNEDVISVRDLEMRIRLVLLSSNLPDTMENRSRVGAQVLRKLVDEHLQTQEADKQKVSVLPGEINAGIANIERQNNMPKGGMESLLKSKGIDPDTLRQQIKAEISWSRASRRELAGSVKIGEEEVDSRLQTLRENLGKPEYLAAEIYLPVDQPAHQAEMESLGSRLLEQLKQGAAFSALARQFSQTGGGSGGDLGWVSDGMLDEQLMGALANLQPGSVSPLIHAPDGLHIMLLRDKRIVGEVKSEPVLDLAVVQLTILPSATPSEKEDQMKRLRDAASTVKNCDDFPKALKGLPSAEWSHPGKVKPSEIPREVLALIDTLPTMQLSQPQISPEIQRFYLICGRTDPVQGGLPSRDDIHQRLEDEKMDVQAKRYLRDIRRAAFVEFRV